MGEIQIENPAPPFVNYIIHMVCWVMVWKYLLFPPGDPCCIIVLRVTVGKAKFSRLQRWSWPTVLPATNQAGAISCIRSPVAW